MFSLANLKVICAAELLTPEGSPPPTWHRPSASLLQVALGILPCQNDR